MATPRKTPPAPAGLLGAVAGFAFWIALAIGVLAFRFWATWPR